MGTKQSATAVLEHFDSSLWGYHFMVPEYIARQFIEGQDRRVICTVNRTLRLQCALMPRNGEFFILLNNQNRKKLQLSLGEEVHYELEKDRTTYGLDMPEELSEMLGQDDGAHAHFHALSPGKQRSLIYIVSKVKNTDSRIRKALAIVHHLNESNGQLDFRQLNETIKHYNGLKV
jgi:hypothetical protein